MPRVARTDGQRVASAGNEPGAVLSLSARRDDSSAGLRSHDGAVRGPVAVLGIDASLSRTAFATLDTDGNQHHEVITTRADWPLPRRLRALADAAYRIATEHQPLALVVIEEPGFVRAQHGVGPITALGRAQGAIIAGLPSALDVEAVMVSRMRSALQVKIPRGKGAAKPAILAYVEARGITVPRLRGGAHDDDVADAYLAACYGIDRLA